MAIDREKGVRVVTVGDLLAEDLRIPAYQRPYSWKPDTAVKLLEDVREAFQDSAGPRNEGPSGSYVLGAVILHADEESGQLHVVDGQQRLLTLTMILDLVGRAQVAGPEAGTHVDAEDPDSAVVVVRKALARRVALMSEPLEQMARFIRSNCELIRVETDDADEAFRVFDSQNYRGKALLPHDLLKAHHVREMQGETISMKAALVEGWEAVPDAELDRLFSTYLWRITRWSRGLAAPKFAVEHIDAFKGLSVKNASTPSARYHLAAQAAVPMLVAWTTMSDEAERDAGRSRFQLDAPVLAGRAFFEMVTFMLSELKNLREEGFHDDDFERFASSDSDYREITSKSRYRYTSELYLAALLYYSNKFGDSELQEAKQRLFKWSFSLRTRYQRVQLVSVNNHASRVGDDQSAFVLLRDAETPSDLRNLACEVRGRDQDPEHEKDLLQVLSGLEG